MKSAVSTEADRNVIWRSVLEQGAISRLHSVACEMRHPAANGAAGLPREHHGVLQPNRFEAFRSGLRAFLPVRSSSRVHPTAARPCPPDRREGPLPAVTACMRRSV